MVDSELASSDSHSLCHDDIHDAIAEIKIFWDQVNEYGAGPKYEEMGARLREFRSLLANHFIEEQHYLHGLMKRGMHINRMQYDKILDEHTEFLERLADDIERLENGHISFGNWASVWDEFDTVIDQLAVHEAGEHDLCMAATEASSAE